VPENLGDLRGTGRVGGVDVDDSDVERAIVEGGPFLYLHNRPDRVISTQVVVQPEFVDPLITASLEVTV
jgi:hypothetical protein